MKLLIISGKRSGKDTLAEYWRDNFGLTFKSSSEAANEIFIFDKLKNKYGYKTLNECFEDRVNHRSEWYDLICEYNKDDKARLAKEILKISDCYVGMRDDKELQECELQQIFDLVIWVDASERVEDEGSDSMKITKEWADVIIENNDSLELFEIKAEKIGRIIFKGTFFPKR